MTIFTFANSTTMVIPDGADLTGNNPGTPVTTDIVVTGVVGHIVDVDVVFNDAHHTFINDLHATVTVDGGATVNILFEDDGSRNFDGTYTWDDDAAISITGILPAGGVLPPGSYGPHSDLNDFNLGPTNTTWHLTIQDFFSADTGSLDGGWSLIITTVPDLVVVNPIPDQNSKVNAYWTYMVPPGTFDDDGSGPTDNAAPAVAALTYTTTLGNGDPLPYWLSFDPATQTFTGTPPLNFVGPIELKVTANDGESSTSDTFTFTVTAAPPTVINLSPNPDTYAGDNSGQTINGLGSGDTITGGLGNDTINGGDGDDHLNGGGGQNVLHGDNGNDLVSGTGNLNLGFGDAASDLLYYIGNQNQLFGGFGDDWLGVNGDNNALSGGFGDDWLGATGNINTINGQIGNDFILALGSGNTVVGELGFDWLGVSGNGNTLVAGEGNDWLGASGQNNTLDGGTGNDTLVAAPGSHQGDTFVFHAGYGLDEISGFARHNAGGTDVVDLKGFGFANFAAVQALIADSGGNAVLTINALTVLTIDGVLKAQLQASDFLLA